jgi:hypothetical protein
MSAAPGRFIRRVAAILGVGLGAASLGQSLDYDRFSDQDGFIAPAQETAAWALLRDPVRLEQLYADVAKGNERALHVFEQLEVSLAESGRQVAERVTRPECLVPAMRELSGSCVPDWSFLNFLAQDKPGAARLRQAISKAFAARAHQRGLENRLVLSAITSIVSVGVAASVLREAETVAEAGPSIEEMSRAASVPDKGGLTRAGRALQKHGDRPGSAFPQTKGGPAALNPVGQRIVDEILRNPASVRKPNRFEGVDVIAPDGRGVRFDGTGQMMGFLEP